MTSIQYRQDDEQEIASLKKQLNSKDKEIREYREVDSREGMMRPVRTQVTVTI